jgi:aminoglycoside 3-N-acetyltransferase
MKVEILIPRKTDLLLAFQTIGIKKGDVLYVAASLAALGLMENPVESALWALREAVGPEGTLVMPTYNFEICRGSIFNPITTPSQCGILSETFRKQNGVCRTLNPPYHSVAVQGPLAETIIGLSGSTSFGPDTAFQYLYEYGARCLLFGCDYEEGVGHFHWMEEIHQVPYRFWKTFTGKIQIGDEVHNVSHKMYARQLEVELDANPAGEKFEKDGWVKSTWVGGCQLRIFGLKEFKEYFDPLFKSNPTLLVKTENAI